MHKMIKTIGKSARLMLKNPRLSTRAVVDPILTKLITAAPFDLLLTWLMAIMDAFGKMNDNPNSMTIIGKNKEAIGDKSFAMSKIIRITPALEINMPAQIIDSNEYCFENLAEDSDPSTKPMAGITFAIPYSALRMPIKLMATKGAMALKT